MLGRSPERVAADPLVSQGPRARKAKIFVPGMVDAVNRQVPGERFPGEASQATARGCVNDDDATGKRRHHPIAQLGAGEGGSSKTGGKG